MDNLNRLELITEICKVVCEHPVLKTSYLGRELKVEDIKDIITHIHEQIEDLKPGSKPSLLDRTNTEKKDIDDFIKNYSSDLVDLILDIRHFYNPIVRDAVNNYVAEQARHEESSKTRAKQGVRYLIFKNLPEQVLDSIYHIRDDFNPQAFSVGELEPYRADVSVREILSYHPDYNQEDQTLYGIKADESGLFALVYHSVYSKDLPIENDDLVRLLDKLDCDTNKSFIPTVPVRNGNATLQLEQNLSFNFALALYLLTECITKYIPDDYWNSIMDTDYGFKNMDNLSEKRILALTAAYLYRHQAKGTSVEDVVIKDVFRHGSECCVSVDLDVLLNNIDVLPSLEKYSCLYKYLSRRYSLGSTKDNTNAKYTQRRITTDDLRVMASDIQKDFSILENSYAGYSDKQLHKSIMINTLMNSIMRYIADDELLTANLMEYIKKSPLAETCRVDDISASNLANHIVHLLQHVDCSYAGVDENVIYDKLLYMLTTLTGMTKINRYLSLMNQLATKYQDSTRGELALVTTIAFVTEEL